MFTTVFTADNIIQGKSFECEEAGFKHRPSEFKRALASSKSDENTRSTTGQLNVGRFTSSVPLKAGTQLLSDKVNEFREHCKFECGELRRHNWVHFAQRL